MEKKEDIGYMEMAIELASRGAGWVNPNPQVGAVIVKDGRVIAEGWHERYGGWHAERNAFRNCLEDPTGATMYVTLEPCCHYGKTPPCTEAIVEHRIARVVVGMTDPNPLVAGKGIELLRNAGIEVVVGVLTEKIKEQNRIFLKYISTCVPWLVMKTAMTLDGKIATHTGDSRWVTGEESRRRVQEMRHHYMGIMVGGRTVKIDNPLLNCRLQGEVRQPVRIVVDSRAELDLNSQLVETAASYRTILAHTGKAKKEQLDRLTQRGIELLCCEECDGRVNLKELMEQLGKLAIDSILLEGGGQLNESFLRNGLVDEVYAFIAPKIIGGRDAKTPVEGEGFEQMSEAILLQEVVTERSGDDILIRGRVRKVKGQG